MLLVDEATSALDAENEAAVVDALAADPRSRTRVIVAHRLASIRHADRVLFVDDGRVVEDGSISELLTAVGVSVSSGANSTRPPSGRSSPSNARNHRATQIATSSVNLHREVGHLAS